MSCSLSFSFAVVANAWVSEYGVVMLIVLLRTFGVVCVMYPVSDSSVTCPRLNEVLYDKRCAYTWWACLVCTSGLFLPVLLSLDRTGRRV